MICLSPWAPRPGNEIPPVTVVKNKKRYIFCCYPFAKNIRCFIGSQNIVATCKLPGWYGQEWAHYLRIVIYSSTWATDCWISEPSNRCKFDPLNPSGMPIPDSPNKPKPPTLCLQHHAWESSHLSQGSQSLHSSAGTAFSDWLASNMRYSWNPWVFFESFEIQEILLINCGLQNSATLPQFSVVMGGSIE